MSDWEVHAVRYAERAGRTRADSFLFDDRHDAPHPMDYFIWVLRRGTEVILVDTGYDADEGARRGRPVLADPRAALAPLGITAEAVEQIDRHPSALRSCRRAASFPQRASAPAGGGDGLCHRPLHVPRGAADALHRRSCLRGGAAGLCRAGYLSRRRRRDRRGRHRAPHRWPFAGPAMRAGADRGRAGWCWPRTRRISTRTSWRENPFPSWSTCRTCSTASRSLERLASDVRLIVPGHDPLVRQLFAPSFPGGTAPEIFRLDPGPVVELPR